MATAATKSTAYDHRPADHREPHATAGLARRGARDHYRVHDPGEQRRQRKYSYQQLEHSAWNGWTLTDLVFPSFLFIAGISIVFSNESRLARGESKTALRLHVLKRSVILFLLGW